MHIPQDSSVRLTVQHDGRHVHVVAAKGTRLVSVCAGGVPRGMFCAWEGREGGEPLATYRLRRGERAADLARAAEYAVALL